MSLCPLARHLRWTRDLQTTEIFCHACNLSCFRALVCAVRNIIFSIFSYFYFFGGGCAHDTVPLCCYSENGHDFFSPSSKLTWMLRSRRDGRSANGTLTFRRSSTTPLSQTSNPPPANDNAVQLPTVEDPIPQPTTYEVGPSRYTKDDLLEMYQSQRPGGNPSHLFISGWDPSNASGSGVRGWGKSNENHVPQDPGTCWDFNGDTAPIGLSGFSQDEKEVRDAQIF